MAAVAAKFPDFREAAEWTMLVDAIANAYYGYGYRDVQHRAPGTSITLRDHL